MYDIYLDDFYTRVFKILYKMKTDKEYAKEVEENYQRILKSIGLNHGSR